MRRRKVEMMFLERGNGSNMAWIEWWIDVSDILLVVGQSVALI